MYYYIYMKKFIKYLLLSPILLSAIGCAKENKSGGTDMSSDPVSREPTPVNVVVISGQSNAVGCTHSNCITRSMGASYYQEYMRGYPQIQIAYDCWTKDVDNSNRSIFYSQNQSKEDNFVKVMLGQGNSLATFGPEIGIAEELHEEYEEKLFIIKYACGASNLKDDWLQKNSPIYPRLINYVKKQMQNLQTKGYIPTIKAFCWMQGEGDAWDGYYQEYEQNIATFAANIRADLKDMAGNKDVPFIDAGISNSKQWQYYRQVNQAKQEFAKLSDNNIYIDTIGAGMHTDQEPFDEPDTAHYDTESEVLLGHLFADAFKPFLTK